MLDALPDEIIFGGSATESINLALNGGVRAWKKAHPKSVPEIVVSEVEHAAVLETASALEADGVVVRRIPVRANGTIDLEALRGALNERTVVVATMYANNEVGTIMPIRDVAKILRDFRFAHGATTREELAYPILLVDACQAAQYLDISVRRLGADLLVLNAAKIGGPKGASILFRRRPVPLIPMVTGGGQEAGYRAGTEDVVSLVGLVEALRIARGKVEKESKRVARLRDRLERELSKRFDDMHVNGALGKRLPNYCNVSFRDADHENIAVMLDREGIAVSTKSACNETDAEHSHVLAALRKAGDGVGYPDSGIRITLGVGTSAADIDATIRGFERIRSRIRPLI
jgi:cysteine desulfurase